MFLNLMNSFVMLSSITGFQSFTNYSYSIDDIRNAYQQSIYEFNVGDDVYGIDCSNQFLEVEINDEWCLYDKSNKEIIIKLSQTPYNDNNVKFYSNSSGDDFFEYNGDNFVISNTNYLYEIDSYLSSYNRGHYYSIGSDGYSSNTHLIDNYYYFHNLKHYHGNNSTGTCSIVAAQIIFGYYDTFYNDTIVDEQYDISVSENKCCISDFEQSPGTGMDGSSTINSLSDSRFHDLLVQVAIDAGENTENAGLTSSEQLAMINRYFNIMDISYSYRYSAANTEEIKNIITSSIDSNRPVYCGGAGHTVVAYGYDTECVYVHTGWGYVAKTPWSTFTGSALDILITEEHYHSNNYYSTVYNKNLCGCTEVYFDSSTTLVLDVSNYTKYYRVHFDTIEKIYVSFRTTIDEYDTRFINIETTCNYTYYDDIDPDSDYSNYNANLIVDEMDETDKLEFTIDLSSVPIDTYFNIFTIILE